MTRIDQIKKMGTKELAIFLAGFADHPECSGEGCLLKKDGYCGSEGCDVSMLRWLIDDGDVIVDTDGYGYLDEEV